jgi:hypothetical protein
MSTQWNWSWVATREETKKASDSVDQSGGTMYTYRTATRGQLRSSEFKNSMDSVATNINHQWRLWRVQVQPILDSLPAGPRDQRWRPGIGLPGKIDALNFGIQGSTLFVFNDADTTKASGRYWHSIDERPKTIAEAFEDLRDTISDIEVGGTTTTTSVDLNDVWLAIGHHYQDSSLASAHTSLDARTNQIESNMNQLSNDLYGANEGYGSYDFGVPLAHSIAKNIDYILQIHGISSGWQNDPSTVNHSAIPAAAHVHPYTEISPMPSSILTQARTGPFSTISNDILRLRYEIQRTRGSSSWYSDATDPVDSGVADLHKHVNHVGSGTSSTTNPHGITANSLGILDYFVNLSRFTGITDYTSGSEMPTYTSIDYVTQGVNLETAIGELDAAIATISTSLVTREDYSYDRSSLSETERMQNPIIIVHNIGKRPQIEVHDLTPEEEGYWGQYISPSTEAEIVHLDNNSFEVWTPAAQIQIVAMF